MSRGRANWKLDGARSSNAPHHSPSPNTDCGSTHLRPHRQHHVNPSVPQILGQARNLVIEYLDLADGNRAEVK